MATVFQTPVFPSALSAPGPIAPASTIPSGTFVPGTKVQVGGHRVVIEKYLSEGGFAHVYLVRLPKPIDGEDTAVLKRVAVSDKEALANMRTEVETMKKLKGRRHIVTYHDSHASQLKGGGYEVFLLMEYCNGGGLIDFMNTRLQNRLTEPEILKIFSDVAQGVACMHYLKPPLLHRDLKVENVLITKTGSTRLYKLCDFGSTAPPRPAATNAAEGRLIEEDVQKHTTLQYRSPEMIDVYRKQPIDEKSDVWALGVLLYKLCYYKTPFEEQGQMAILNASFKFPAYPAFSDKLKKLIALMLRENPQHRPNIYQTVREISLIRGTDIPIKDIYAGRTQSEARRNQHLPSPGPTLGSPPVVGAFHAPTVREKEVLPDIAPMRRGRPIKASGDVKTPKPSPSPLRPVAGDPFTALDSNAPKTSDTDLLDDVSARFPALDDFSILHDKGTKFAFDPKTEVPKQPKQDLSQRVTNALADDAFAYKLKTASAVPPNRRIEINERPPAPPVSSKPPSRNAAQSRDISHPASTEPHDPQKSIMVSTGTMTSPPRSPTLRPQSISNRPIFRVPSPPSDHRSSSQPRNSDPYSLIYPDAAKRPATSDYRETSQLSNDSSTLGRPSFDSNHKQSYLSSVNDGMHRSKSASTVSRPSSMQSSSKPNILRRLSRERPQVDEPSQEATSLAFAKGEEPESGEEASKIDSNVEYLKVMEEEDTSKRKEKRLSGGSRHVKRASMPSMSLAGTKQLLAGRFGEAFRKFETNNGPERRESSHSPTPGPSHLTPIEGSEATDGRSDDGKVLEESEEAPPEVRRELERRRLSQEERRVTDAAAAYRQRLAEGGDNRAGPSSKATSIQSKVKSLLDESGRASPSPTKTASGYGRFTDQQALSASQPQQPEKDLLPRKSSRFSPSDPTSTPKITRYPPKVASKPDAPSATPPSLAPQSVPKMVSASFSTNDHQRQSGPSTDMQKPPGPPKPQPKPLALRTGDRVLQSPAKPPSLASKNSSTQHLQPSDPPAALVNSGPDDDWETSFSKRYPDLSGLEMVETEIDHRDTSAGALGKSSGLGREMKVKDV